MSDPERFRFNLDDEEPEEAPQDEALQRRVNKLSQRMSFVTLLLPCLLAIVIYVVYRDIGLRLTQTQTSEQHTAETLAIQLEQKFGALPARIDALEAGLNARIDALPKNLAALQEEVRKLETALGALKAEKAEKKEIGESLARVDGAIAAVAKDLQALAPFREELGSASAVRQELSSVSARLLKLENSLGKDLTGLAGYIDRSKSELAQIKSELARLGSQKLDREAIDLEILKSKKIYQMALDQEAARIDKSVSGILRRLDQLERAFSGAAPRGGTTQPPAGGIREQPVD
jgi:chromosome segregation ATPase